MTDAPFSAALDIDSTPVLLALSGPQGKLLTEVARQSGADVSLRGNTILMSGEEADVRVAQRFLSDAAAMVGEGVDVGPGDVAPSLRELRADETRSLRTLLDGAISVSPTRKPVVPKTAMQRNYVEQVRKHDLTFGIGPAGTGKTYLAMAMGVSALLQKKVKRIILTRPAVEAGEKLGFLPGDLAEKVNPYLRPLYDALHDMLEFDKVQLLRERGQIEVAPLAFMRGRTLNNSFIILDEAQNATSEQMRMFLTRMGYSSKGVVTGDVTQTDLPKGGRSGLAEAWEMLRHVKGIGFNRFTDADVVRHPLVQRIVVAYEKSDAEKEDRMSLRPPSDFTPEPPAAAAKTKASVKTSAEPGTESPGKQPPAANGVTVNSDGGTDVESQH
jgi:phosphate starvation-inducible protein PhoH and related proteins